MSEKRILLASLLKPVNDTRMYGKLGLSLCKLPGVQVHVAGFKALLPEAIPSNMHMHSVFSFRRLSIGRFTAQRRYWSLLKRIKPDLVIVCTHELLLTSWLFSKMYSCRLVYDVQENYSLNLTAQETYNPILKRLLAAGVRSIEHLTAPAIKHFFLAERSYAEELCFIENRYTIIENKYNRSIGYKGRQTPVVLNQESIKLLYSGTISGVYGVFEAVKLAEELHNLNPRVTLTIIGYCAHAPTLHKLRQAILGKSYITLIGGDMLIPHADILQAIENHSIGLLPYQPNASTFRCIPTKLYEYMAYGLPVLMQQNPIWDKIVKTSDAGLSINFNNYTVSSLLQSIYTRTFYNFGIPETIFWDSEESKLITVINTILQDYQKED